MRENLGDARIVGDQQRSGRRAHENLDADRAGQAFQLSEVTRIFMGAADPEGEITMHAASPARDLVGKRFGRGRQRFGVGHFEDGRDAAKDRAARAGLEILLVRHTRFAEMHL